MTVPVQTDALSADTPGISSRPRLGIFWILSDLSMCAFPEALTGDRNGPIAQDSERDHISTWPEVIRRHPAYRDREYEEIPRGRIVYHAKSGQFIAYVCDHYVNNTAIRKSLIKAFSLRGEKIRWTTDEHYNFPAIEIDPADRDADRDGDVD